MMPVPGLHSAPAQRTSGSSERTADAGSSSRPPTPFARPFARYDSRVATSLSSTATTSLPTSRCWMPLAAAYSSSARRPSTHSRAFSEPGS